MSRLQQLVNQRLQNKDNGLELVECGLHDLTNSGLKDLEWLVKTLNQHSEITTLDLTRNNIGNNGIKILVGLKHIHTVDLSDNAFDDDAASYLAQSSFKHMDLSGNELTDDCLKPFEQSMKQEHIAYSARNSEITPDLLKKLNDKLTKEPSDTNTQISHKLPHQSSFHHSLTNQTNQKNAIRPDHDGVTHTTISTQTR